jgi:hypothetical protein
MNIKHFRSSLLSSDDNLKKAIIITEGEHQDSEGNTHKFPVERLEKIVENSNKHKVLFSIKLIKDHKMTYDNEVGAVKGDFELRKLTEDDLPEEYKNNEEIKKKLVGKKAIFNSAIEISDSDVKSKIENSNNISMGLCIDDKDDEKIIEISLVPIPAIPLMRLFNNPLATNWAELEISVNNDEKFKEEFNELSSNLYLLLINTKNNLNNEILNVNDSDIKLMELLNGFAMRVIDSYNKYFVPEMPELNSYPGVGRERGRREDATVTNQQRERDIMAANNYTKGSWFNRKLSNKKLLFGKQR